MAKKKIQTDSENIQKVKGQVFTPAVMVSAMLDWCGYYGSQILGRHVADNSCGDGAFLVQVVCRYLEAARAEGLNDMTIRRHLQIYIHGMDCDREAVGQCRVRLDEVAAAFGFTGIRWKVYYMDSLSCRLFNGMMHYVIGNPPYVRLHNLQGITSELLHDYTFTDKGAVDLYLAFFELGFRMLHPEGQLCYITPVSWIYSKAGKAMRKYIMQQRNLLEIVDLEHHQVFDGVCTYTLVSRFSGSSCGPMFRYARYNPETGIKQAVDDLSLSEVCMDDCFCMADKETLKLVRAIDNATTDTGIQVRNGFATLADSVFIGESVPDSPYTIPVLKASTGKWSRCFFPYDSEGRPIPLEVLRKHRTLSKWLTANQSKLKDRDIRQVGWWLFGRSQAVNSVAQPKLAVNALVRDQADLKVSFVEPGQGVYSGYYVTAEDSSQLQRIHEVLMDDTFIRYIRSLKKYKSGGYYTFSAVDVSRYLHFMVGAEPYSSRQMMIG